MASGCSDTRACLPPLLLAGELSLGPRACPVISRQSLPGGHCSLSAELGGKTHSIRATRPLLTHSALSPGNHLGGLLSIPSDPRSFQQGMLHFFRSPSSPRPRLHGDAQSWSPSEPLLGPALKRANPAPSPCPAPASPRPVAQLGQWQQYRRPPRTTAEGRGPRAGALGRPIGEEGLRA